MGLQTGGSSLAGVMRPLCQLMAERNHPRSTAMTAQIKVPLRRPARPDTDHQVTQPGCLRRDQHGWIPDRFKSFTILSMLLWLPTGAVAFSRQLLLRCTTVPSSFRFHLLARLPGIGAVGRHAPTCRAWIRLALASCGA